MAFSDTDTVVLPAETGGRGLGGDQAADRPTEALGTGAPAGAGGWGPVSTGTIHRTGWLQSWGDFHKEITPMPQPNLGARAQGDRQHHPPGAQMHSSDPRDALHERRPVPACTPSRVSAPGSQGRKRPITGVGTAGRTHRSTACHSDTCMWAAALCYTRLQTHSDTHCHLLSHTHTPTLTLTLTTHYHSHTLRHTLTQILGNTLTHSHSDTTHTLRHTHSHTLAIHSHPYTHSYFLKHSDTHTHSHIHTLTCTHNTDIRRAARVRRQPSSPASAEEQRELGEPI